MPRYESLLQLTTGAFQSRRVRGEIDPFYEPGSQGRENTFFSQIAFRSVVRTAIEAVGRQAVAAWFTVMLDCGIDATPLSRAARTWASRDLLSLKDRKKGTEKREGGGGLGAGTGAAGPAPSRARPGRLPACRLRFLRIVPCELVRLIGWDASKATVAGGL